MSSLEQKIPKKEIADTTCIAFREKHKKHSKKFFHSFIAKTWFEICLHHKRNCLAKGLQKRLSDSRVTTGPKITNPKQLS